MKYPSPTLSAEQIAQLPYRPGVGIMLVNQKGQVFVAQRLDNPGPAWQMPQGGIDKREEPLQAAWREMREEIGTDRARFIGESRDWLSYDLPAELVPQLWKGRFRGQRQKWFAFRFLGTDRDINIATRASRILVLAVGRSGGAAGPDRALQAQALRRSDRRILASHPAPELNEN